ncbi:MAG: condensation domain-containing protein, partial [Burkholderiaceae bacterium]
MTDNATAAGLTEVDYDPFASDELARAVPTTEAQREVWLADRLSSEASLAYNESVTLSLVGRIDMRSVQNALLALSDRHEALRSTISDDGMNMLIAPRGNLHARVVDLSGDASEERVTALAALKIEAVETPFDLQRGPLIRAVMVALGDSHALILTAHHIACDGWSFGVLVKDFTTLYDSIESGRSNVTLPSADSFGDFALSLGDAAQLADADADNRYWVALYDGSVPMLELPSDHARPATRTFRSDRVDLTIPASLVDAIRQLGAKHGASLFVALFSTYAALMSRLCGSDDVVIGVPAAGQSAHGKNSLVGHCANLLPIRVPVDIEQTFPALLASSRSRVLDAYEHQSATFGGILRKLQIERDPGRLPLVSVLFNLDAAIP